MHITSTAELVQLTTLTPIYKRQQRKWFNRKSLLTQNVFCAVQLDGSFSYVLAGAEGPVNDATLLRHAVSKNLHIPEHRFYISNAGLGARPGLLLPYPSTRYHLNEWRDGGEAPKTKEELYNLRHSRLRVVVEMAFGGLKKKFRILRGSAPEYSLERQILIIYACTGLFNFILAHSGKQVVWSTEEKQALNGIKAWADLNLNASNSTALWRLRQISGKITTYICAKIEQMIVAMTMEMKILRELFDAK